MNDRVALAAISHIGNSRNTQEDNYLVRQEGYMPSDARDSMSIKRASHCIAGDIPGEHFLVAVSDGMGGHACGEVASLLTVQCLSERYEEVIASIKLGEQALAAQISRINDLVSLMSKKDSSRRGMGATLCGVISNEYELVGFNVGDSRLYQFRNGILKQLSTDHTEGQRLINMRLLTEEEAKRFPRRKMLHRYIGYDGKVIPDIFRISGAECGSVLMLCTDGLSDVLSGKEMEHILNNNTGLKERAELLVNEAVSRNVGHGDNITVILIEF